MSDTFIQLSSCSRTLRGLKLDSIKTTPNKTGIGKTTNEIELINCSRTVYGSEMHACSQFNPPNPVWTDSSKKALNSRINNFSVQHFVMHFAFFSCSLLFSSLCIKANVNFPAAGYLFAESFLLLLMLYDRHVGRFWQFFFCVRRNCEVNEKLPLRGSHFAWKGLARAFHVGCATLSVDRLFFANARRGSELSRRVLIWKIAIWRRHFLLLLQPDWFCIMRCCFPGCTFLPRTREFVGLRKQKLDWIVFRNIKTFWPALNRNSPRRVHWYRSVLDVRLFHWEASTARVVVVQHDARWRCLRAALTFNPARTAAEKNSQTT